MKTRLSTLQGLVLGTSRPSTLQSFQGSSPEQQKCAPPPFKKRTPGAAWLKNIRSLILNGWRHPGSLISVLACPLHPVALSLVLGCPLQPVWLSLAWSLWLQCPVGNSGNGYSTSQSACRSSSGTKHKSLASKSVQMGSSWWTTS